MIIVSGCQRSGTRFYAKYLAKEKGFKYIDENEYGVHDFIKAKELMGMNCVLHAPALKHKIREFKKKFPDVVVYWLFRNEKETIESMKKVWNQEEAKREIEKMLEIIPTTYEGGFLEAIHLSFNLGIKYLLEGTIDIMMNMKSIEDLPGFKKNNGVIWKE